MSAPVPGSAPATGAGRHGPGGRELVVGALAGLGAASLVLALVGQVAAALARGGDFRVIGAISAVGTLVAVVVGAATAVVVLATVPGLAGRLPVGSRLAVAMPVVAVLLVEAVVPTLLLGDLAPFLAVQAGALVAVGLLLGAGAALVAGAVAGRPAPRTASGPGASPH